MAAWLAENRIMAAMAWRKSGIVSHQSPERKIIKYQGKIGGLRRSSAKYRQHLCKNEIYNRAI